jgi:hypothetical protein
VRLRIPAGPVDRAVAEHRLVFRVARKMRGAQTVGWLRGPVRRHTANVEAL